MTASDFLVEDEAPRIDASGMMADLEDFISTYVVFPSLAHLVAVVLWVVHAHLVEHFDSTPRLAFLSPEPGSGKSRALEVLELVVPRPMAVLSASAPAIFRSIGDENPPTLLFDEVDALFGRRGTDDSNEDLRALLNAGHRHGAQIPRCAGPLHSVTMFPVYAAVAYAGLGDAPETLMTRSVVIRMRRRAPEEKVTPFRHRVAKPIGVELQARLAAWARSDGCDVRDAWPDMPDGVVDRNADVWEPLLAVADAVGGSWPRRAREACSALVKSNVSLEASLGVRLLADLRAVWGNDENASTAQLLEKLCALEESPWGDLRGKPLDARGLARRLNAYGIKSKTVRIGPRDEDTAKGYVRADLHDQWVRYLAAATEASRPSRPSQNGAVTLVTDVTAPEYGAGEVVDTSSYEATDPELFEVNGD